MRHIFSLAVWAAILVVGGMLIRKATYYLLITVPFILYFCTTVFYAGSGFFAHNQSFYTGAHLMGIFQISIAVLVVLAAVFYWQETGGKKPSL